MAHDLCCTITDRASSPDAPGARVPMMPSTSQRLISPYQQRKSEVWNSLTPSDRMELEQHVPSLKTSYEDERDEERLVGRPNFSPARFASALKKRLSKGTEFLQSTPTNLRSKLSKRFSLNQMSLRIDKYPLAPASNTSATLLNASSEFDPDAQILEDDQLPGRTTPLDYYNSIRTPHNLEIPLVEDGRELCISPYFNLNERRFLGLVGVEADSCHGMLPSYIHSESGPSERTTTLTGRTSQSITTPPRASNSIHLHSPTGHHCSETPTKAQVGQLPQFVFKSSTARCKLELTYEPLNIALEAGIWDVSFQNDLTSERILEPYPRINNHISKDSYSVTGNRPIVMPSSNLDSSLMPVETEHPGMGIGRASSNSSVHLHNMRISQHLRSFSNFSGKSRRRSPSPHEPHSCPDKGSIKHRRKSSSGFSSTQVPASWGNVIRMPLLEEQERKQRFNNKNGNDCFTSVMLENHDAECLGSYSSKPLFSEVLPQESARSISASSMPECGTTAEFRNGEECQSKFVKHLHLPSRLDGSLDQSHSHELEHLRVQPTRTLSVRENYNETTAVWEKALRVHQEDQLNPQKRRTSSIGSTSRKSSRSARRSVHGSEASKPKHDDTEIDSKTGPRLEIKRVNTSHSFDLMTMPGRHLVTQLPLETSLPGGVKDRRESGEQRHRSISQPPIGSVSAPSGSSRLLVPGFNLRKKLSLALGPSGSPTEGHVASLKSRGPKRISNLKIWSRFPSHTREARNGPAGKTDKVIVRDFQPFEIEGDPTSPNTTKQAGGKQVTKSKWRTRLNIFKGKYLTDIPALLKNRAGAGFRRREHGHRSSIAVGGSLEYPELELLPRSEPQLPPAMELAVEQSPIRDPQVSVGGSESNNVKKSSQQALRLGSSSYTSDNDEFSQSPSRISNQLTSSAWADIYGKCVNPNARQSIESIPFFDGTGSKQALNQQNSGGALPPMIDMSRVTKEGIQSMAEMNLERTFRRSTQDLHKTLEDGEAVEVARVLKAAEAFE